MVNWAVSYPKEYNKQEGESDECKFETFKVNEVTVYLWRVPQTGGRIWWMSVWNIQSKWSYSLSLKSTTNRRENLMNVCLKHSSLNEVVVYCWRVAQTGQWISDECPFETFKIN